jgi:tripartite-type tricarboxylate transporter receptor subunit TctC
MEKTVKDPKVIAHMKKTKMPYEWLGPEESTRRIRASYEKYKKYVHLFKKKKKK